MSAPAQPADGAASPARAQGGLRSAQSEAADELLGGLGPAPTTETTAPAAAVEPPSRGHEVTAVPANPAIETTVLIAVVVIIAALLGLLARFRDRVLAVLARVEVSPRTVAPPAIGLAIAVMLFPDTADRMGLVVDQGTRASLRILPAAVDVGLRCATSSDTLEEDGCATHGALAMPRYLGEGTVLVLSEIRLARPGLTPSQDDVQLGLRRAAQERRWGLLLAPNTARAYGQPTGRSPASSPLRLSSVILILAAFLLGAWGARALQGVVGEVLDPSEEPSPELRQVRSARLKNISLIGVLVVGAYLGFAALTALGPFLQAQKLAASPDHLSAEDRIAEVEAEWRAAETGITLGSDDDLDQLEAALPHFAALRQELMQRGFDRLAIDYADFEEVFDRSWRELEPFTASGGELQATLEKRGWPADRSAQRTVRSDAKRAQEAIVAAYEVAQSLRDLDAAPEPRLAAELGNALRSKLDLLTVFIDASVAAEDEPSTPALEALRTPVRDVRDALQRYRDRYEHALEGHRTAETTTQDKYADLVGSMGKLREHRQLMRQALLKLDRRMVRRRLEARRTLSSEQARFSAVQRAGPGWMDRMQSLASWFEQSFQQEKELAGACADDIAGRAARERIEVLRAVALLPKPSRQRRSVELASLQTALDTFHDDLSKIPDLYTTQPLPDCATTRGALPALPDRIETSAAYGAAIGILSGWLLQSDSMDVVLLAGMLGFGLLGSGLSRIVRRRLRPTPGEEPKSRPWLPSRIGHEALVENVPAVVFQGLGATLVVYLAGVGGIGALTVEPPDLNPHVLMLSCFAASVFSEDVWKATQRWMSNGSLGG